MEIPDYNNVYGCFVCSDNLEKVAKILMSRLNLSAESISVKKSQFDGTQKMRISSEKAEFEAYRANKENEYLFNGAVAGTEKEVYHYTKGLQKILNQSGYASRFEIYDEDDNCIGELIWSKRDRIRRLIRGLGWEWIQAIIAKHQEEIETIAEFGKTRSRLDLN